MVDDAAAGEKDKSAAIKKIDQGAFLQRVKELEAELDAGSARQGQRWYVQGTSVGLLLISAVFAGAAIATTGHWNQIFEGSIFGAFGALASVFFRISRGKLEVDAQQGKWLVYRSAVVKPLIGAIFGGIIVALLLSGLPQIEVPAAEPKHFYFLGVLAFVAGFSERFAPNLLQFTEERVEAEEATKPEEAPKANPKKPAPAVAAKTA